MNMKSYINYLYMCVTSKSRIIIISHRLLIDENIVLSINISHLLYLCNRIDWTIEGYKADMVHILCPQASHIIMPNTYLRVHQYYCLWHHGCIHCVHTT